MLRRGVTRNDFKRGGACRRIDTEIFHRQSRAIVEVYVSQRSAATIFRHLYRVPGKAGISIRVHARRQFIGFLRR